MTTTLDDSILDSRGVLNYAAIRAHSTAHPHVPAPALAAQLVAGISHDELVAHAVAHISSAIADLRRGEALAVERRAEIPAETSEQRATRVEIERFERCYADPAIDSHVGNIHVRKRFRQWLGDRFDNWYARALAAAEATGNEAEVDILKADYYPGGVAAYDAMVRRQRINAHIDRVVQEVAEEVRLETTAELLGTLFALGDGVQVTWAEASVEQHQQRIALLRANAAGNVEAAARHQAAIRMIADAGVATLGDLAVQVTA